LAWPYDQVEYSEAVLAPLHYGARFRCRSDLLADPDSKPKTLKELQRETPFDSEVAERLSMAQIAGDYEAAMLSASLLEYMLRQAITTKFIPLGQDHLNGIFSDAGNGPLGTFSSKTKIAYALGIIGPETRLQIDRIRDVRNHFAHHKDVASFDHPSVSSICWQFKQLKALTDKQKMARLQTLTPKILYVQSCFYTSSGLAQYVAGIGAVNNVLPPIEPF
jgi:hypothetical protein